MTTLKLKVNGHSITTDVAPRVHLADFLREAQGLTGTHLGCEHGVCGACTVEIDGQIVRSCITYAVGCEGANVRTIEGFDEDPLMARLRAAFTAEHALQCGYCTPGMLIAARDLISRRGRVPEREIREEMSGNLCRCTGYVGIVRAIERVMAEMELPASISPQKTGWLGPLPGPTGDVPLRLRSHPAPAAVASLPRPLIRPVAAIPIEVTTSNVRVENRFNRMTQSFTLPHSRELVWLCMSDLAKTIACVPGALFDGELSADGSFKAGMSVALGTIRTLFKGTGTFAADAGSYTCKLTGKGRDDRGPSSAQGELAYRLSEAGPNATRIDVDIAYALTGPLAQFGRPSLVQAAVSAIAVAFASNVDAAVAGRAVSSSAGLAPIKGLSVFRLVWALLTSRLRDMFSSRRT